MDIRIKKGDSLWKIAKANKPEGVSTADFVQQLLDANELDDPDKLQVGQILNLPDSIAEVPEPTTRATGLDRIRQREELTRRAYLDRSRAKDVIDEVDIVPLPRIRPQYFGQAVSMPSAPDRQDFTVGDPGGLLEEGNINLAKRPHRDNGDGTFSTIVSKSFEEDGVEVLIPTLGPNGEDLTDEQALQRYHETGEFLGKFSNPAAATAYAQRLSLGIGTPKRDPDAFIDTNSERFWEVFHARADAFQSNADARFPDSPSLTPERRARALDRALGNAKRKITAQVVESRQRLIGSAQDPNVDRAGNIRMQGWPPGGPVFQPTKVK